MNHYGCDILLTNSIGIDKSGRHIIHSPSRWSEAVTHYDRWFAYYPFFLGTLSSLLKRETQLKVKMVDGCLLKWDYATLRHHILSLSPRFLFMESASMVFEENLDLALSIKKEIGTHILFAGPHATLYPEECLNQGIDVVFPGEYESSVLDFFKEHSLNHNQKRIYHTQSSIPFHLMPWPEDNDVSRMAYGTPGEPSSDFKEIQMYATRGCRGGCTFCVVRHVYFQAPKHETRNPLDVVLEMEHLKEKYPQLEGVFFDEEDHFDSMDFIRAFCQQLIERKNHLKIEALGRLHPLDLKLLPLMKQAGYYKLRIGVESLDPKTQATIKKRISPDHVDRFLAACKESGLDVYMTFQVGLPGSSPEGDQHTFDHVVRWIKGDLVKNIQISIYTPFPGTPEFQKLTDQNLLTSRHFEEYNGGEHSVVNWPHYSAKEITRNYHQFLMIRDHYQLVTRLKSFKGLHWILDRLRKHSLSSLTAKILKRLILEVKFRRYRASAV